MEWWLWIPGVLIVGLVAFAFFAIEWLIIMGPNPGEPRTDSSRTSVDEEAEDLRHRIEEKGDAFRRDLRAFRDETIGRLLPWRNRKTAESGRTEADPPASEQDEKGGNDKGASNLSSNDAPSR